MLSRLSAARNEKGFTLIELLIVIAIIGILAAIAIPQFSIYKQRAYESDAKANLHNLFLACKAYWADETSGDTCVLQKMKDSYGFFQSADVVVGIGTGTELAWTATGQHTSQERAPFNQGPAGNIS